MSTENADCSDDRPQDRRIFRYEVEVRDLASGEVRHLPVAAFRRIPLVYTHDDPPPTRVVLRLTDDNEVIEATTFDAIVATLRDRYPDGAYERRFRVQRDHDAERRRDAALSAWIDILVDAACARVLDGAPREADQQAP